MLAVPILLGAVRHTACASALFLVQSGSPPALVLMDLEASIEAKPGIANRGIDNLENVAYSDVRADGGPIEQVGRSLDKVGSTGSNAVENELETRGWVDARAQKLHRPGWQAKLATQDVF